jgi:hypothetical protein
MTDTILKLFHELAVFVEDLAVTVKLSAVL